MNNNTRRIRPIRIQISQGTIISLFPVKKRKPVLQSNIKRAKTKEGTTLILILIMKASLLRFRTIFKSRDRNFQKNKFCKSSTIWIQTKRIEIKLINRNYKMRPKKKSIFLQRKIIIVEILPKIANKWFKIKEKMILNRKISKSRETKRKNNDIPPIK